MRMDVASYYLFPEKRGRNLWSHNKRGKSILIVDDTEYIKAVLSHHTLSLFNVAFKQLFLLAK